jgi:hypothetical protein
MRSQEVCRREEGGNWKSVWAERKLIESSSICIYLRKALTVVADLSELPGVKLEPSKVLQVSRTRESRA